MEAIKAVGLSKRYGNTVAVHKLDLEIKTGELFALLGVNGAGKTTTVKMLSCLASPDEGDAYVLGKSVVSESLDVKSVIGVSPQETAVAQNLSVEENLELMCGIYGFSKEQSSTKISELSGRLGLSEILGKRAGKLSGGFQRRLSIAMALIGDPKVLFLDEPTLGLDVITRSELWDLIRELKGRVTVVLTTHYMEEAEALSDRVGIMRDGRLLAIGTPSEIMELTGEDRFENAFISVIKGASV